ILASQPIHDIQYGPQAALVAESFPGALRYSGASLGYQLASITAGGPAPLIALALFRRFGTASAVAVYVSLSAIVSLVALRYLPARAAGAGGAASPWPRGVVLSRERLLPPRPPASAGGRSRVLATALTAAVLGVEAHLVRVEADTASGFPKFTMVGLPDSAV